MIRKGKMNFAKAISLLALLMTVLVFFSTGVFADGKDRIMYMDETTVTSGDPIVVHIKLPEDHEIVSSDWLGVYEIDVDESSVYDGAGLGIWCYIGTNERTYGRPEGREVDVEIDELISTSGNWPLTPGEYKVLLFFNDSFEVAASCPFDVVAKPTPEPTETPEPTATPEATDVPSPEPEYEDNTDNTEKGCGGVILSSSAIMTFVLLGAAVILRKKH